MQYWSPSERGKQMNPSPSPQPLPGADTIEGGTLLIIAIVIAVCGVILYWSNRPLGGKQ